MGLHRQLTDILSADPLLVTLGQRLAATGLPDAWLVAGTISACVWNHQAGRPALSGVKDFDLVYFDPDDLSAATEQAWEARFADLPLPVDVKNQARVPLWFEQKFGMPCPPYANSRDAIASYPTTATTIGARWHGETWEVHATFGLEDLFAGIIRPNRRLVSRAVYEAKSARWQANWPGLTVLPWGDTGGG